MHGLAKLLYSDGEEGGLAIISIYGIKLRVMDCLGYGIAGIKPKVGDYFKPYFSCLFSDDEDGESVFNGNPQQDQKLESTGLWSYRAYGKIVELDGPDSTASADCGGIVLPMPIQVSNVECLGLFVVFHVSRLDAYMTGFN